MICRCEVIDRTRIALKNFGMTNIIYPRSPRETMCGWMHLPRYVDKIRLHLAGKLHKDYQDNFGKGFDGWWLELRPPVKSADSPDSIETLRTILTDGLRPAQKALIEGNYGG